MAARVEHASETRSATSSGATSGSGGGARRPGLLGSLFGGGLGGGGGRGTAPRSSAGRGAAEIPVQRPADSYWGGQPGFAALLAACGFGVVSFVFLLFANLIAVDDRGDPIPTMFGGVYLRTRTLLTGDTVERTSTTVLDALGPGFLLLYATPLVVLAVAFLMYRSTRKSRSLTAALLAMAVLFFINIGLYYLPSLIFLGIAVYQARKFELPGRMAAQQAARDAAADDEDEEYDEEDEYEDEDYEDDEYEDEDEDAEGDEDDELADDEEYEEDDELVEDEDEDADADEEPVAEDEAEDEDDEVVEPDEVLGPDDDRSGARASSDENESGGGRRRRRRR
jgi:hypothetical protein